MQNKKAKTAAISAALVGVLIIGGLVAYFTDGDTATNEFTVGKISIDLTEPDFDEESYDVNHILPGTEIVKNPQITNDGVNDAYVFMEVEVPYAVVTMVSEDGTVNAKTAYELYGYEVNPGWTEISYQNGDNNVNQLAGTVTVPTSSAYKAGTTTVKTSKGVDITAGCVVSADYYTVGSEKFSSEEAAQAYVTKNNLTGSAGTITAHEKYVVNGKTFDNYADAQSEAQSLINANDQDAENVTIVQIGTVKHLYAWVDSGSGDTATMKVLKAASTADSTTGSVAQEAETTDALFDAVEFINTTEDQGLESADLDIVTNAYAIQTTVLNNNDDTIDGTNDAGVDTAAAVWDVLEKQSNSTSVDYIFNRDRESDENFSTDITE